MNPPAPGLAALSSPEELEEARGQVEFGRTLDRKANFERKTFLLITSWRSPPGRLRAAACRLSPSS